MSSNNRIFYDLIDAAFLDDELISLCKELLPSSIAKDLASPNLSQSNRIQKFIDHVVENGLTDKLLIKIKKQQPEIYDKYEPHLAEQIDKRELRKQILSHYELGEFIILCEDINQDFVNIEDRTRINFDNLEGGLERKVAGLISFLSRRERINYLIEALRRDHPEIKINYTRLNLVQDLRWTTEHDSYSNEDENVSGYDLKDSFRGRLPYYCDRKDQRDELKKAVDLHSITPKKNMCPLFCIIHGPKNECHDAFIERIPYYLLPGSEEPLISQFQDDGKTHRELEFPSMQDKQRGDYIKNLSDDLSKPVKELLTNAPINNPLIIYSFITPKEWEFGREDLINAYIRFWDNYSVNRSNLFVCLCIEYKKPKWFNSKLRHSGKCREFLETINFSEFSNIHGVILPELRPIGIEEANSWARSSIVKHWWKRDTEELKKEIDKIYSKNRSIFSRLRDRELYIPMTKLAEELDTILTQVASYRN